MSDDIREFYDALVKAIYSGASSVTVDSKTTAFRSLGEMWDIKRNLESTLGIKKKKPVTRLVYRDPRSP